MIGTALLFDFIQFMFGIFTLLGMIPVVGMAFIIIGWALSFVVSIYAWLTFFVWFKIKNVSTWESLGKYLPKIVIFIAVNVLEWTPFGFLVPGLAISVAVIVAAVQFDDKKHTRIAEEALEVATALFLSYMRRRRGNIRGTVHALDDFSFGPQRLDKRFEYFGEGRLKIKDEDFIFET